MVHTCVYRASQEIPIIACIYLEKFVFFNFKQKCIYSNNFKLLLACYDVGREHHYRFPVFLEREVDEDNLE